MFQCYGSLGNKLTSLSTIVSENQFKLQVQPITNIASFEYVSWNLSTIKYYLNHGDQLERDLGFKITKYFEVIINCTDLMFVA